MFVFVLVFVFVFVFVFEFILLPLDDTGVSEEEVGVLEDEKAAAAVQTSKQRNATRRT